LSGLEDAHPQLEAEPVQNGLWRLALIFSDEMTGEFLRPTPMRVGRAHFTNTRRARRASPFTRHFRAVSPFLC
jgi:hypothetical protein